jgi:hypothetical protein
MPLWPPTRSCRQPLIMRPRPRLSFRPSTLALGAGTTIRSSNGCTPDTLSRFCPTSCSKPQQPFWRIAAPTMRGWVRSGVLFQSEPQFPQGRPAGRAWPREAQRGLRTCHGGHRRPTSPSAAVCGQNLALCRSLARQAVCAERVASGGRSYSHPNCPMDSRSSIGRRAFVIRSDDASRPSVWLKPCTLRASARK